MTIWAGANGEPRKNPFCGMPLYIVSTSDAPGSPVSSEPKVWTFFGIPAFEEPPVRTIASTTATATTRTTPPPIASTRGFAWRRRGDPFDCTGGGAAAAARLSCLLFLPLGTGGKRSVGGLVARGREE